MDQLKQGLRIAEQIAALEAEMASLFQGSRTPTIKTPASAPTKTKKRKKPTFSPQALANIRAAQKKRWAKVNAGKTAAPKPAAPKKKSGLTPEGRKKLALAMKRRWAEARKTGAPVPTASKDKKK